MNIATTAMNSPGFEVFSRMAGEIAAISDFENESGGIFCMSQTRGFTYDGIGESLAGSGRDAAGWPDGPRIARRRESPALRADSLRALRAASLKLREANPFGSLACEGAVSEADWGS